MTASSATVRSLQSEVARLEGQVLELVRQRQAARDQVGEAADSAAEDIGNLAQLGAALSRAAAVDAALVSARSSLQRTRQASNEAEQREDLERIQAEYSRAVQAATEELSHIDGILRDELRPRIAAFDTLMLELRGVSSRISMFGPSARPKPPKPGARVSITSSRLWINYSSHVGLYLGGDAGAALEAILQAVRALPDAGAGAAR